MVVCNFPLLKTIIILLSVAKQHVRFIYLSLLVSLSSDGTSLITLLIYHSKNHGCFIANTMYDIFDLLNTGSLT